MTTYELSKEQSQTLQKFWEEGLLWLVNTAILHPRGYALTIVYDDEALNTPLGLFIQGDGDEPWCFGDDEATEPLEKHQRAMAARELLWQARKALLDEVSLNKYGPKVDI